MHWNDVWDELQGYGLRTALFEDTLLRTDDKRDIMPIFLQDYLDWLRFMIPFWGRDWAEAFWFTQAFEMPVYLVALYLYRPELRWYTRAVIAFGASAITHPFVWFFFPYFSLGHEPAYYWNVVVPAAEIGRAHV